MTFNPRGLLVTAAYALLLVVILRTQIVQALNVAFVLFGLVALLALTGVPQRKIIQWLSAALNLF
jgi:hypothetical protein